MDNPAGTQRVIDWVGVRKAICGSTDSARSIAARFDVTEGAIRKRITKHGWTRPEHETHPRSVSLKVDDLQVVNSGFLYVVFIQPEGSKRLYKIGMTTAFSERMDALQTGSPYEVMVACAYFVANVRKEERELHEMFSEKRARGEWFRLDEDDLRLIAVRSLLV